MGGFGEKAVQVSNPDGASPFVLVCDHASNRIPAPYGDLGLSLAERVSHIAWDPGALAVSNALVDLLDAPLVGSTVSRLVIDCNRRHDAPDLIPAVSENTKITANASIDAAERRHRIEAFHAPFHAAIEGLLDARLKAGRETILVCMHSFTPVYKDVKRPWPIGLIHGRTEDFTRALADTLHNDAPDLNVGWNQPYSARDGVTYTLETHGEARGLAATMIEIRNNEILEPDGVTLWAARLARGLGAARGVLLPIPARASDKRFMGQ